MLKKLIYIAIFTVLLVSCEEYYKPDLDVVPGLMVVESHLTNDPKHNFVKLTKTLDFYNKGTQEPAVGAEVELVSYIIKSIRGRETSAGYFTFSETPEIGKKYLLRVGYQNDTYESDVVIMPPLPTIDTLYTTHKIEIKYRTDAYGKPEMYEIPGREIDIDAPISSNLAYYRFTWRAILQWTYQPPGSPPQPRWFGWKSKYDAGNYNIAGPKEFSLSAKVTQHPVLSLEYDTRAFLDSASLIPQGWIVIIDQYGISKESYTFHEKLNKQFSADGSLFDPVMSQVYGNIHCINDPSKIALGFFDLNSYRQYRYFLNPGINEKSNVIQRRINLYPDIPGDGYMIGTRPSFWEQTY